jgi:hypothetical protein
VYNVFGKDHILYGLILILTINNPYVDVSYLRKRLLKILKDLRGYRRFTVTSTGVLILFYDNHVVKIPLGEVSKQSLDKNWDNYNSLKQSEYKRFVDYELTKMNYYYKMEKLESKAVGDEIVNDILNTFSATKSTVKLYKFKDGLFANLSKIESLCNMNIYFPHEMEVKSVVMHGDLTRKNIMTNNQQNIVLIDLNRFTFEGIDSMDAIHYMIDKESKKTNTTFFEYLENKICSNTSREQLATYYIYLLLRVCFEHSDLVELNKMYHENIKRIVEKYNLITKGR